MEYSGAEAAAAGSSAKHSPPHPCIPEWVDLEMSRKVLWASLWGPGPGQEVWDATEGAGSSTLGRMEEKGIVTSKCQLFPDVLWAFHKVSYDALNDHC